MSLSHLLFGSRRNGVRSISPGSNPTVRGVRVHAPTPRNVVRHNVRRVERATTSLVQERGWRCKGNAYRGSYACRYGTWEGLIEQRGDIFNVLIYKPPREITHHNKFVCFHRRQNGWWAIHLHHNPRDHDVGAIIGYVERLLVEAIGATRR